MAVTHKSRHTRSNPLPWFLVGELVDPYGQCDDMASAGGDGRPFVRKGSRVLTIQIQLRPGQRLQKSDSTLCIQSSLGCPDCWIAPLWTKKSLVYLQCIWCRAARGDSARNLELPCMNAAAVSVASAQGHSWHVAGPMKPFVKAEGKTSPATSIRGSDIETLSINRPLLNTWSMGEIVTPCAYLPPTVPHPNDRIPRQG